MSSMDTLLQEYCDTVRQMAQLEQRKTELRQRISEKLKEIGQAQTATVGDTVVNAAIRRSVKIDYDEDGLRGTLGNRFRMIVQPDVTKIKKHLQELSTVLNPFLDTIGSVSPELMSSVVQAGHVREEEISPFRTCTTKETLYVTLRASPRNPFRAMPDVF